MVSVRTIAVTAALVSAVAAAPAPAPQQVENSVIPAVNDIAHMIETVLKGVYRSLNLLTKPVGDRVTQFQNLEAVMGEINNELYDFVHHLSDTPALTLIGSFWGTILFNPLVHAYLLIAEQVIAVVGGFIGDGPVSIATTLFFSFKDDLALFIKALEKYFPNMTDQITSLESATSSLGSVLSKATAEAASATTTIPGPSATA
ncbi:YALI0E03300p [Yarrowia lipolytica CLIB122]|uniref:YALI0E03300p n=3 Tax=Yarrowia lipolytica TaxID=4952 RepID=Q6C769_YARLI|nr:YALI0E03300p [Yarrowia lipolytica CLIB122]AOW04890.1 hypothetical protein YALI1_E03973g [Yarrowia lipolytica]KAJ8056470.1 hypothetical protein LXG23DRAFT_53187 [Yarrowia lipolytica]QNQ00382.1 Hypothetical protein YALI2_E01697g [Yarrowia lipolytica]CAG79072.1 YALI0E03300p [Yarrowia lipolytica CLIB122]SEI34494.1 YALIA101S05e03730g1_1 [Yarrowia lipolytica]|eukprot:XP_503493.1 YALI0E03300p [Yarrowia lipolytica CLIB122]